MAEPSIPPRRIVRIISNAAALVEMDAPVAEKLAIGLEAKLATGIALRIREGFVQADELTIECEAMNGHVRLRFTSDAAISFVAQMRGKPTGGIVA